MDWKSLTIAFSYLIMHGTLHCSVIMWMALQEELSPVTIPSSISSIRKMKFCDSMETSWYRMVLDSDPKSGIEAGMET